MRYVVVGGGIAGVSCALELGRCLQQRRRERPGQCDDEVVLVSSSSVIKGVRTVAQLSRLVTEIEVVESSLSDLAAQSGGAVQVVHGAVTDVDLEARVLLLRGGEPLRYDKLCLCTGARPKELDVPGADHPAVMTLRDTDSIQELARRLRSCRRLVLAGNGGIALELVGALTQQQQQQQQRQTGGERGASVQVEEPAALASERPVGPEAAQHGHPAGVQRPAGVGGGGQGGSAGRRGVLAAPELVWALKHAAVGDAFFDVDAAQFMLERIPRPGQQPGPSGTGATGGQACPYPPRPAAPPLPALERPRRSVPGHAAGPCWTRELVQPSSSGGGQGQEAALAWTTGAGRGAAAAAGTGAGAGRSNGGGEATEASGTEACGAASAPPFRVVLEFSATVARIDAERPGCASTSAAAAADAAGGDSANWPLHVTLTNGKVYGADLVVCGLGVVPSTGWLPPQLQRAADGGLAVRRDMRTSDPHTYAAGDCCTLEWPDMAPHWFQMRLWTQARVTGTYAAQCMLGLTDDLASGFNFELFTHVTRFLGTKVVLLGLYNGQRLEGEPAEDVQMYSRAAPDGDGATFVRVLLLRGRMQGAVLIGDTELEEVLENIILDGLDLTEYGPRILDPDFELSEVFD